MPLLQHIEDVSAARFITSQCRHTCSCSCAIVVVSELVPAKTLTFSPAFYLVSFPSQRDATFADNVLLSLHASKFLNLYLPYLL